MLNKDATAPSGELGAVQTSKLTDPHDSEQGARCQSPAKTKRALKLFCNHRLTAKEFAAVAYGKASPLVDWIGGNL